MAATPQDLFLYHDGNLVWKEDRGSQKCKGQIAGSNHDGYVRLHVSALGGRVFVHNIIWEMFHGKIPSGLVIDHIDGDRANNCIENLRIVSRADNGKNMKLRKDNKSGIKNVVWHKTKKKWCVSVTSNKERHFFGDYDDLELAELVAHEAREKLHKQFARHF